MIIRLPIDLKSLYVNVRNDNQTGHTPTVATPLRQGKSIHTEIAQILQLNENIPQQSKDGLSLHLLAKTRTEARIVKAYLFNRILVNGTPIQTDASYCIYIREETNPANVHFGRQKVHYPQVLEYEDEDVSINNQSVLRAISNVLHDYAFIVQAFEFDTETNSLNFDVLIVGEGGIPYSKVFQNKRGVGEKFSPVFSEYIDNYDSEIIALRRSLGYDSVCPENYLDIMGENKCKAVSIVENLLDERGLSNHRNISAQYPYSLFDIEVKVGLSKHYIIVLFTSTSLKYFSLSMSRINFINRFSEQVRIMLVSSINTEPIVYTYTKDELSQMKKTINTVTYEYRGV